jgi:hypothetical protein
MQFLFSLKIVLVDLFRNESFFLDASENDEYSFDANPFSGSNDGNEVTSLAAAAQLSK